MKNFKEGGFKGSGGFSGRQKFSKGGDRTGNGRGKFGGNKSGGKFGGKGDRENRPFNKPELFAATCSSCGKPCEVPFKPSGDKPVFCSACFGKSSSRDKQSEERGGRDERKAPRNFKKESYPKREDRTFRPDYSEKKDNGHEELKKQIALLESKINRVLELLNTEKAVSVPTTVTEEAPKKVRKPKTIPTKAVAKKKAVKKAAKVAKAIKKKAKAA
jgi:CxxC-x17-CxxC domain-containing protein